MGLLPSQQWLEPFEAWQEDYGINIGLNNGLRQSISGGVAVVLVLKNLVTQGSDQLITQSGDTFTGNVR